MIGLMKKVNPEDEETTTYSDSSGKVETVEGSGEPAAQHFGFTPGGHHPADDSDIRKYHKGGVVSADGRNSEYRKVYVGRKKSKS